MNKVLVDKNLIERIYDIAKNAYGIVTLNEYGEEIVDYFAINDELLKEIKNILE